MKNLTWRLYVTPIVIIIAVIFVLPTLHMRINDLKDPALWPYRQINLGLDLMGGMHLVLEVDTEKYMEDHMSRMIQDLRELLRKEHIKQRGITQERGKIIINIKSEDSDAFIDFMDKDRKGMASTFLVRLRIGASLVDAKGLSKLYKPKVKAWHLAVMVIAALITITIIMIFSEPVRQFFTLIAMRLQVWLMRLQNLI